MSRGSTIEELRARVEAKRDEALQTVAECEDALEYLSKLGRVLDDGSRPEPARKGRTKRRAGRPSGAEASRRTVSDDIDPVPRNRGPVFAAYEQPASALDLTRDTWHLVDRVAAKTALCGATVVHVLGQPKLRLRDRALCCDACYEARMNS